MTDTLPRSTRRELQFAQGTAIGFSHRWEGGQYCSILTPAGIVGCGIYDLETAAEFGQAVAIARGTPARPLCEPEDLFEARIVGATPQAAALGIKPGMTGREAAERMLAAKPAPGGRAAEVEPPLRVRAIDHVTLVVADLERSRAFYCGILGMVEVVRPGFSFPGLWFQAGSTQIHLILAHDKTPAPGHPLPPAHVPAGRVFHFAFEVSDARRAYEVLTARSVRVRGEPQLRPDGCVQVFCHDPDGHVVEIFHRP